jgi:putative tributyrin esterase
MSLNVLHFESQYLHGNTTVSFILPDKPMHQDPKEFYRNQKKYKVLWLLHGTFGDYSDWLRKTNIELYACEKDLVVVMPSALNSDYSNWDGFMMGYSMFDYLTEELMPLVYGWFPVSEQREDNFIAGLSMGGGAAVKYAIHHPEKFAAVADLSGPVKDLRSIYAQPLDSLDRRFINRANNGGGVDAYLDSYENSWDKLAALAGKNVLPRLYFASGTKDYMYDQYLKFKKYAGEIGLDATFEEIEGYRHEWRFWDIAIQHALTFFNL